MKLNPRNQTAVQIALLIASKLGLNKDANAQQVIDKIETFHKEITRLENAVRTVTRERDEADRRAGAAERQLANASADLQRLTDWRDKQKEAAGYHRNISFDVVWQEALTAMLTTRGRRPTTLQHWKDAPALRPIPAGCDKLLISAGKWQWMAGGDGDLHWATDTHYAPKEPVFPDSPPEWATHVVYFGK
jgi:DNA-binding protein H-NS